MSKAFHDHFKSLSSWLVITGAGISQSSGIPTYRNKAGEWKASEPIQHQDFINSIETQKRYWARSAVGWPKLNQASPNIVHKTLVELENRSSLTGVITQNVDRLHQQSGQKTVVDLHGRVDRVRCLQCGVYEERAVIQTHLIAANPFLKELNGEMAPDGDANIENEIAAQITLVKCQRCGGAIIPDVVFYGGTIPAETHEKTKELYQQSEGLLVLGSSLMVYSSYRFCKQAVADRKPLIIINQGITRADSIASLKLDADCKIISVLNR